MCLELRTLSKSVMTYAAVESPLTTQSSHAMADRLMRSSSTREKSLLGRDSVLFSLVQELIYLQVKTVTFPSDVWLDYYPLNYKNISPVLFV